MLEDHSHPNRDPVQLVHSLKDHPHTRKHGNMDETVSRCHKPNCDWIFLGDVTGLTNVPPLRPNPELSGIGVILGFSITAYLTLVLLMLHYITVHDHRRTSSRGKEYTNCVDRGLLTFIRARILAWSPSRRFEYAMEKAVLILSDMQLVTGLAFLISGYSQLNCGISSYHWQVMIYVAWFSSFSFLSAMTFLEGYFQTNHSLRIIRVCFMFILATFLIVALFPTGSHNWLNLLPGEGGFYPGLSAKCYFEQMRTKTYNPHGGPKIWSMVVSIFMVGISYSHSGIRLFDPTAELTRKYFRHWPGNHIKRLLYFLEKKSSTKGLRAAIWTPLYLLLFAEYTSLRAIFDIAESMLLEIIWLTFAIGWGTIKLYDTRRSAIFSPDGTSSGANHDVLEEDYWSFGQTLPLVLLLLPVLSMAQAYLDNDAKAQEAAHKAEMEERREKEQEVLTTRPADLASVQLGNEDVAEENEEPPDLGNSTLCTMTRCNHHPSLHLARTCSTTRCPSSYLSSDSENVEPPPVPPRSPHRPFSPFSLSNRTRSPRLPQYPYHSFSQFPWYNDHVLLLILQILLVTSFALFLLTQLSNFLGLSVFIRNRLFLGWALGIVPAASFLHLATWYVTAWIVKSLEIEEWLILRKERGSGDEKDEHSWWRTVTFANVVFWSLRMFLVCGLVVGTFFVSIEIAGPDPLAGNF